jgi:hypothetical protein
MSLVGAADTLWVLQRCAGEADAALRITGRDVDTQHLAMQFQEGFWTALGDAQDLQMSQTGHEVLALLQASLTPLTPTKLATTLGVNLNRV